MRTFIVFLFCSLAASTLSASNVTAYLSGGNLYLFGDSRDSSIAIDSPANGQIRVSGMSSAMGEATFVNGTSNGSVVLNGWTGGIFAYLYAGHDSISIRNLEVRGATHVDLGPGNDQLTVGPSLVETMQEGAANQLIPYSTMLDSSLYIIGADGNDRISISRASILGRVTIDSGNGSDFVEVGTGFYESRDLDIQNSLAIYPGNGLDCVFVTSAFVRDDLFVDDTIDALDLDVYDVAVGRNAFIYGTPAADDVNLENLTVNGFMDIITEGAADTVYVSGSANRLTLILGEGNDSAELENFDAKNAHIALDGGADTLTIYNCAMINTNCFGSSGNDYFDFQMTTASTVNIYGDGGIDTLFQMANSIGQLRTYSVENQ